MDSQLHANELPLKHLIIKLDGKTTGHLEFTGNISKQLKDYEQLPIVQFELIDAESLPIDTHDLSTDQKYLLMHTKLCLLVSIQHHYNIGIQERWHIHCC